MPIKGHEYKNQNVRVAKVQSNVPRLLHVCVCVCVREREREREINRKEGCKGYCSQRSPTQQTSQPCDKLGARVTYSNKG